MTNDFPPLTLDDLTTMANRIRIPQPVSSAADAGTVWRTAWDGESAIVVVMDAARSSVHVAPVIFDFDSEASDRRGAIDFHGHAVVVLWQHRFALAPVMLDECFGRVKMPGLTAHVVGDAADDEEDENDGLAERLEPLRRLAILTVQEAGDGTLPDLLRQAGVGAGDVASAIGVKPAIAAQIFRGARAVTEEEAARLTSSLAVGVDEILVANPRLPDIWWSELAAREYRTAIVMLAERWSQTDSMTARTLAYGAFALAARQPKGAAESVIRQRIVRYIETRLAANG